MKKVFFAALFSVSLMTANAQEPNIPMFGGRQNIDVKFDEYKAAPQGFNQERAGIAKGTVKLIEYQSESVGTIRKANVYLPPKYDAKKKYSVKPTSICHQSTMRRKSTAYSTCFMVSVATRTNGTRTAVCRTSSWTTSTPMGR